MKIKGQSEIISKVLGSALRLWLRSQVETVEELHLEIRGGDRQILGGYIPEVFLNSSRAVYQGLHLGQVQLTGANIRVNLGQVLKGKSLKLLEPVPVTGKVLLAATDLKASLQSPLLANALTDLLVTLLAANGIDNHHTCFQDYQINWQELIINIDKLILAGKLIDAVGNTTCVTIYSGLTLVSGQKLRLHPLQIEALPTFPAMTITEFEIDLGSEVELEELSLAPGQLVCTGRLTVLP